MTRLAFYFARCVVLPRSLEITVSASDVHTNELQAAASVLLKASHRIVYVIRSTRTLFP